MNNYLKIQGANRKTPQDFFPFDDRTTASFVGAVTAARKRHKGATLAVYAVKGVVELDDDMRCIGHSPKVIKDAYGANVGFKCLNCGQTTTDEKHFLDGDEPVVNGKNHRPSSDDDDLD